MNNKLRRKERKDNEIVEEIVDDDNLLFYHSNQFQNLATKMKFRTNIGRKERKFRSYRYF